MDILIKIYLCIFIFFSSSSLSFSQSINNCPQTQILNVSVNYTLCNPNATSVVASISSGLSFLSYSIDGGITNQTSPTFNNVPPGNYILQVTDAFNCTSNYAFTVSNPSLPTFTSIEIRDANCVANSGVIEFDVVGGTGNYTYSMIFPSGSTSFVVSDSVSGLIAGSYTIIVEDANGCEIDTTVIIQSYTFPIIDQIILNNPSCNSSNGSIEIILSNPPPVASSYTTNYSINGGFNYQSSSVFTNLPAGNYSIYAAVTSCLSNFGQPVFVTLFEESYVNFTSITIQNSDCGVSNGTLQMNVNSSNSNLLFSINGGPYINSTGFFSNLSSGTYSISVLDSLGCTKDTSVFISENPGSNFSNISTNLPNCGESDGQIIIQTNNNSISTVEFSIDNGLTFQTDSVFSNLISGFYTIILQNNPNCSTDTTIFLQQENPPTITSINFDDPSCGTNDGLIEIFGSHTALEYSIDGGLSFQNSGLFTDLASGNYSIVVQSNPVCFDDTIISLEDNTIPIVNAGNDQAICQGESIALFANYSPGAVVTWNNSVIDGQIFNPTSTLNYIATATFPNGCSATDTVEISLIEINPVEINYTILNNCLPVVVNFTLSDSLISFCNWNATNNFSSNDCESTSITFEEDGCYNVTFSGVNQFGCTFSTELTEPICIDDNPQANFSFSPQEVTSENSIVQFQNLSENATTFEWLFPEESNSNAVNPNFTLPTLPGNYPVTLIAFDEEGCFDSITQFITVNGINTVFIPNSFTPDVDEFNQTFKPILSESNDVFDFTFLIYNRWGEVLFESKNPLFGWDGTYNGQLVQSGTYPYKIVVNYKNNAPVFQYVGNVNLLK